MIAKIYNLGLNSALFPELILLSVQEILFDWYDLSASSLYDLYEELNICFFIKKLKLKQKSIVRLILIMNESCTIKRQALGAFYSQFAQECGERVF